jgi:hypothetical protein
MKKLMIFGVLAACGGDPLKKDVEMFCNSTVGTNFKSFIEIAPYVAEHAKSDEFMALLMKVRNGQAAIWDFETEFRAMMAKVGVDKCPALDVVTRNKPKS